MGENKTGGIWNILYRVKQTRTIKKKYIDSRQVRNESRSNETEQIGEEQTRK